MRRHKSAIPTHGYDHHLHASIPDHGTASLSGQTFWVAAQLSPTGCCSGWSGAVSLVGVVLVVHRPINTLCLGPEQGRDVTTNIIHRDSHNKYHAGWQWQREKYRLICFRCF